MLQKIYKLNTLLLLSSLFIIGLSACKKPTSDKKAQKLVSAGVWKHDLGTIEFKADGTLIAKVASGKKLHNGTNPETQYTAKYVVTKDKITITRDAKEKGKTAQLQGSDVIFGANESTIVLDIVKLKKKEAIVSYKGKTYTFTRA